MDVKKLYKILKEDSQVTRKTFIPKQNPLKNKIIQSKNKNSGIWFITYDLGNRFIWEQKNLIAAINKKTRNKADNIKSANPHKKNWSQQTEYEPEAILGIEIFF